MRNKFVRLFAFISCFFLFVLGTANAQSPAKFEFFELADGTRVLSPIGQLPMGSNAARGQAIWNNAMQTDGGMPLVSGTGKFRNPSGAMVPVTSTARVTGAGVGAAVGRAIPKLLKQVAGPLVVGVTLYDLAKEIGYILDNSTGQVVVTKTDPTLCTVAPCLAWRYSARSTMPASPNYPSQLAACQAVFDAHLPKTGVFSWKNLRVATSNSCYIDEDSGGWWGVAQISVASVSIPPVVPVPVPSTQQEFIDAIASKSGWPSGSKIGPLLRDSLNAVPSPPIEIGPLTSTGPSTTTGPSSTTTNTTNNTTSTTTVTHNHQYAGDTVTTTTTTKVTTINNSTGAVTNNEIKTETPPPPDDYGTPTDSALPGLPVLYTPKYPDGLTGVWNTRKAELLASPLLSLVSVLTPTIGSGGAYPVWIVPVNFGGKNFGTYDVSLPTYVWDFLKWVVLISAAFLCRALIFGG